MGDEAGHAVTITETPLVLPFLEASPLQLLLQTSWAATSVTWEAGAGWGAGDGQATPPSPHSAKEQPAQAPT